MSNYKTVFFTLGILQIILGTSMLIPILIQIIYDQLDSSFIAAGIITIIFGVLFFRPALLCKLPAKYIISKLIIRMVGHFQGRRAPNIKMR